jgi:hypothetical protein
VDSAPRAMERVRGVLIISAARGFTRGLKAALHELETLLHCRQ